MPTLAARLLVALVRTTVMRTGLGSCTGRSMSGPLSLHSWQPDPQHLLRRKMLGDRAPHYHRGRVLRVIRPTCRSVVFDIDLLQMQRAE